MFFAAEGMGVEWPGGDLALLYLGATLLAATQVQIVGLRQAVVAR